MGKEVARETWGSKLDFMLSAIGFAVGLGNIWRFPYLCYRNGGGAFLIPYVIMLVISGLPLFFFELALGQFSSEGPITVWKVSPIFYGAFLVPYGIMLVISGLPIFFFELSLGQFSSEGPITLWKVSPLFYGIGWGMVTVSGLVCIYYNVIIMYAIYYMFVSFVNLDGEVPWIDCDNPWNTKSCRKEPYPDFPSLNGTEQVDELYKMMDDTCVNKTLTNMSMNTSMASLYTVGYEYMNVNMTGCLMDLKLPSDEYWTRFVLRLHESDGIDDIGGISLKNVVCLFLAWVLIFFCLIKGIKSSGKVVYFTATFPYVLLIVLLVRGLTLPGFKQGIEFYIIPEWERLKDPKVWSDAATQIFYSLGPAFGGLMTMSSFNQFKNNCFRDSLIVAFINCATSVFGGFAIFSLLGFMAHTTNQKVEDVADSGPGLAFVAYPEGLARLPVSSLWAFLFFFMILTLGLDSQMVMMETVISGITDLYPHVLRKKKALFTFIACMTLFLLGIPMTTKGGILVLTVFDWYSGSYNLMVMALCELVVIVYVYGLKQWMKDIEMMIGKCSFIFWAYYIPMWCFITPAAIIFILVSSGVNYTPVYYYADDVFPVWAQGIGWMLAMLPVACVVVGVLVGLYRYRGDLRQAIKPKPDWGPRLKVNRTGIYYGDNYGYEPDDDEEMPKIYTVDSAVNAENGVKSTEFHKL